MVKSVCMHVVVDAHACAQLGGFGFTYTIKHAKQITHMHTHTMATRDTTLKYLSHQPMQ